jgi:NADPH:quinone reductase-like Zn-dependent oxidoreductase
MRGDPWLVRLMFGLRKPRSPVFGADVAGVVDAVGPDARGVQVGEEVFGDISACGFGGWAEYATADAGLLVPKPASLSFEEAAAIPAAGMTALQGVRDVGGVKSGDRVLVNGASGGVGMFAVQIAKAFGAEVTAVASSEKLEMVRTLGADRVVDYTQEDPLDGAAYDAIVDAAAFRPILEYRRAMRPGAVYVLVGGSTAQFVRISLIGPLVSMTGKQMKTFLLKPNAEDLAFLAALVEAGTLRPHIDRAFTLDEVPDAVRHMEARKTRGKIVISV